LAKINTHALIQIRLGHMVRTWIRVAMQHDANFLPEDPPTFHQSKRLFVETELIHANELCRLRKAFVSTFSFIARHAGFPPVLPPKFAFPYQFHINQRKYHGKVT
jgi:hypothetical protein